MQWDIEGRVAGVMCLKRQDGKGSGAQLEGLVHICVQVIPLWSM